MGVSIPSEAEYAEQNKGRTDEFSLFPADDYILEVSQVTEQPNKVDIFDKPKPGEPQRTYTGLEVRFRPVSFANGDELQDENGDDVPETRNPLFFDWFDPTKVGLKPQPAKARKFFTASLGVELEDRVDIEDFQSLVGKRLIGTVIIKKNETTGNRNNRITSYRKVRARRGAAATPVGDPAARAASRVAPEPAGALPNQVESPFGDDDDLPF